MNPAVYPSSNHPITMEREYSELDDDLDLFNFDVDIFHTESASVGPSTVSPSTAGPSTESTSTTNPSTQNSTGETSGKKGSKSTLVELGLLTEVYMDSN